MRANAVLHDWIESESTPISEVLMRRARWAAAHAVGDVREMAWVVAEAHAIAATVFDPEMNLGVALMEDIAAARNADGLWTPPPLMEALASFDQRAARLFDIDRVAEANVAESEAIRLFTRGQYHLALPLIDRVIDLRLQTIGAKASPTLTAKHMKGLVLLGLGHPDEALPLARATLADREANPALGPAHPDTLASRFLVAQILAFLGHDDEALPLARATLADEEANPALGPAHPHTLESRYLVAQILTGLGHHDEALLVARATLAEREANPALGPAHPDTLTSRFLVAQILTGLGHHDEALPLARATLAEREANPALGPAHPDTLASRFLVAQILAGLGHHDEALPLARATLADREAIRQP